MNTLLLSLQFLAWYIGLSLTVGALWCLWAWVREWQIRREWRRKPVLGPYRPSLRKVL